MNREGKGKEEHEENGIEGIPQPREGTKVRNAMDLEGTEGRSESQEWGE